MGLAVIAAYYHLPILLIISLGCPIFLAVTIQQT